MEETFIPKLIYESMWCVFMYYLALCVTFVKGLFNPDCTMEPCELRSVIILESVLSVTFVNKTLKPPRTSGIM